MADRPTRDEFDDPEGLFSRLVTTAGGAAGSVFENRSLMISAGVFVVVVALSGVIWASYPSQNPLAGDGAVPIIRADAQAYKYTPSDRGGMAIPHQDSTIFAAIKNDSPDRKVENLLAENDEQPMDRQQLFAGLKTDLAQGSPKDDGIQVAGVGGVGEGYAGRPMSETERRAEAAKRNREMLEQEASPLPADVKDNSGKLPDVLKQGDIKPNSAESEQIEIPEDMRAPAMATGSDVPANDPRVPKPVLVQPTEVGTQGGTDRTQPARDWAKPADETEDAATEAAEATKPVAPKARADVKTATKANAVAKTAPAAGGNAFVQVASVPDEARVKGEWSKLTGGLPMLAGKSYRVQAADLGAKGTFYRIQVGPMSKDAAVDLCTRIKAKKPGGCLIAR